MQQHERTLIALDDQGREYIIDMVVSVRDLSDLAHAGAVDGSETSFRTREGHAVTHLGGGEFSIRLPGEEEGVTVRTDDPAFT
ncbi:MAG: hypothetical protein ACOC0M_09695 [Halomonas sp.]